MTEFISVYMTASSLDEAQKIAKALVEEKLAACVNIFPNVQSVYRWDGQVKHASEQVLIAKTSLKHMEALKKLVQLLNSNSVPCIVATPLVAGFQPYLDWLKSETSV
jgi:periplasmic divalent cation tolerance protein